MEVVHELIYLLDRYSVRHIDVITNPRTAPDKKESRYHDFYAGMRENRWADDAEAAQAFGMEPDSKNWQRFKNEVKKRIANSLLFIEGNEESMSEYEKAYTNAVQTFAVAKVCWARGAKKSFIELANKSLDIAIKYDFLDIVFDACNSLNTAYFNDSTRRKDYAKLGQIQKKYGALYMIELEIIEEFYNFAIPIIDKKGTKISAAKEASDIVSRYQKYLDNNSTLMFNYYIRILDVHSSTLINNWREALVKIKDSKSFFLTKTFFAPNYYSVFLKQESVCFMMTYQFDKANEIFVEARSYIPEGTHNWFKSYELQAVNFFYSQNYLGAWNTYKLVTKHKLYNINVLPLDKETWRLFYAYLAMLIKHNKIQVSPREKGDADKFRYSSWANDISLLTQDKRGSNIPTLIFQVIHLFLEMRLDEFDSRIDALSKYRQRNLDKQNEHFRTDCFLELLELLRDNAHNPKALLEKSNPVLQQLSTVSTDLLDSSFELEVMPYEHQWEWLMEVYDGRRTGKK